MVNQNFLNTRPLCFLFRITTVNYIIRNINILHQIEKLSETVKNKDVVISILGPTSLTKTNTEFMEGISNIVQVVSTHQTQTKQFFYLSTMGVGNSRDCLDWFLKYFIMDFIIKKSVEAHTINEDLISKRGVRQIYSGGNLCKLD